MPTLACRVGSDPIRFSLHETRNPHSVHLNSSIEKSNLVLHHSHSSSPVQLGFRQEPELGLVSILFIISMSLGSFILLALVSLPVLISLRKPAISMDKLLKVVSEEIPGTLSSLKLSGLEINDLTSQLKYLRQRIPGNQSGKKVRTSKRRSNGGSCDSIVNRPLKLVVATLHQLCIG